MLQGALSIVVHRDDIIDFFTNYFNKPNSKLQSVLEDSKCDIVYSQVLAVACFCNRITLPYWNLINSSENYLDLYKFIQLLHDKLLLWENEKCWDMEWMFMRQQSIEKPRKISYLTQRVHMVTQVFNDGEISTQFGDLAVYHSHKRQTGILQHNYKTKN